ncbi:MAG TPA: beta-L-arabinofuranosidase domain-containing protein [Clostridia bacterium]|nr:beta-L-arabinofuranosidase domain-containing protein [Clostridia bacterium]
MKLNELIFKPLTTSEIKPEGWLLDQLKIQASGLSGNLDKFWPDIKDSQWIGGDAEGWERVPYWLDGFIPLAWLLDDEDMKGRATKYIDYIIKNQAEDGWICPDPTEERADYDIWAKLLILKVLIVYHEATGDERIEGVVKKALQSLDKHIDGSPLFNWGQARWFEGLISIWWLYERIEEGWLLDLASKLQGQGFHWQSFFKNWPYRKSDGKGRWSYMSHVVNNAMMLKEGPLFWRMTGDKNHLKYVDEMVDMLDEYHGMVTGVFSGDECLAGKSPVQGTELCAVAEYMYSLEHLISITGQGKWGDRLEKIAYNALPATYSPDMWTHQYDQQVNQVECSIQEDSIFNTNGGESNLFGLEPNFGCCTANLSQPWPKLALSTFMSSSDGVAATLYAPSTVNTQIQGADVSIKMETDYPFRDSIQFTVKTSEPVEFNLWLRIPEWAKDPFVELEGKEISIKEAGFYPMKQKWNGETSFTLRLPMVTAIVPRPNNLYAVTRGPLVYSLPIEEEWVQVNKDVKGREFPHCDYEVLPKSPWNYGLIIDKENIDKDLIVEELDFTEMPFSPQGAPIAIRVKGRKIDWEMEKGAATPRPKMGWVSNEEEELTLVPYGSTTLRMTEMPIL